MKVNFKSMRTLGLLTVFVMTVGCKNINLKMLTFENDSAPTATDTKMIGMNIMDLGTAGHVVPGVYNTNYTKPSLSSLQFLKSRGHNVVRIPFLWERVQPTLGGALNTAYLGYIIDVLRNANTAGLKVILDMHNYGRYEASGVITVFGSDTGPTMNQYKDVWTKIVNAINADTQAAAAVYAYDIMNEPHDFPDTRGTIDPLTASPIATFSTDTETWDKLWDANAVLSRSTRNGGALQVDTTTAATSFIAVGSVRQNFTTFSSAAGSTIRIRGQIPATTQGDYPRIRMGFWHPWTVEYLNPVVVTKGQDFELFFTPTPTQWAAATGIAVEMLLNNPDGSGPYRYFIDDISQGTTIVGKSPAKIWEEYSQAAVDAIRATGDSKYIMIEGYDYSSAYYWATNHPTKWISDSANKIIYSAHSYMDLDRSGTYTRTFAAEVTDATNGGYASVSARSIAYVKNFTDWVEAQGVKGQIGEIGWPNSATDADFASWDVVGNDVLTFLDSKNIEYTFWATGSWLGPTTNNLNVYDLTNTTPLSQAVIIEDHL